MAISTNQFKNGNHIEVDGTIFKIVDFQHVKPGKGGAFVRTKLRRASDGDVIDRTFRAGEKFRDVRTEARKMQFLYADGGDAHFMDTESYEQIDVPESAIASALRWCARATRSTCCSSTISRPTCSCRAPSSSRSPQTEPGPARRHGLGRRHEAGDARDRRRDRGAAVRRASATGSASTRARGEYVSRA